MDRRKLIVTGLVALGAPAIARAQAGASDEVYPQPVGALRRHRVHDVPAGPRAHRVCAEDVAATGAAHNAVHHDRIVPQLCCDVAQRKLPAVAAQSPARRLRWWRAG